VSFRKDEPSDAARDQGIGEAASTSASDDELDNELAAEAPRAGAGKRKSEPVAAADVDRPTRVTATRDSVYSRHTVAPEDDVAYESRATSRPPSTGLGALAVVIVVLLAVAAGLGAAAVVKDRPATWQARSVVILHPGEAPSLNGADAVRAALTRYRKTVANSSFTAQSALKSGMPDKEVRGTITARPTGDDALVLIASASSAEGAKALANAAGLTLVITVGSDQELVAPSPGDRLSATVNGPSPKATRTKPTDQDMLVAGLLAAGSVLLVGIVLSLSRRPRKA